MWSGPNYDYLKWNSIEMEIVPSVGPLDLSLDLSYGNGEERIQYINFDDKTSIADQWH